jgi:flagellar biosynthetic protein FliO
VAGTGVPSAAAASAAAAPQPPAVQPDTAATAAPAIPAAPAGAAPDVAAPRPATPGVATPGVAVPPVTMPSGSSTGSLLQTLFALILVLAVLGALAWFLKRYGPKVGGGNANLRVVGSLNLGGRERIMVVEVGNEWIVVGASPGRINALATMPRQDGQNGDTGSANATLARHATEAPAAHSFADWLKQTIDKRK